MKEMEGRYIEEEEQQQQSTCAQVHNNEILRKRPQKRKEWQWWSSVQCTSCWSATTCMYTCTCVHVDTLYAHYKKQCKTPGIIVLVSEHSGGRRTWMWKAPQAAWRHGTIDTISSPSQSTTANLITWNYFYRLSLLFTLFCITCIWIYLLIMHKYISTHWFSRELLALLVALQSLLRRRCSKLECRSRCSSCSAAGTRAPRQ